MGAPAARVTTTKAYGYIRVSGQGQVEGDGLIRQETAIRDYAKAHDFEVVDVFRDEGVSGTIEDRPALARLMVDLEEKGLPGSVKGSRMVAVKVVSRMGDTQEEKTVLRRMRALRRRGRDGKPSRTYQEIADLLNEEGVPTKTGGQWSRALVYGVLKKKTGN